MTQERIDKLQAQADKMQSALCSITGILEARVDIAISEKDYRTASRLIKDLQYMHKNKPLGNSSKLWLKNYEELREKVIKLQVQQA